jgi:ferredoxin-NADP reductase
MTDDTTATASVRTPWQNAKVVSIRAETPHAKTLRLALTTPAPHRAGQHFVVRLTAPDGYTASRSYSVASPPDDTNEIELTIERLADGEVSPFLCDEVEVGDDLEVRGPIGGWFVWNGDAPALLIGGGSGVVPLMAMLRMARRDGRADLLKVVVSARSPEDLYYADEIMGPETTLVFTRVAPAGYARAIGRLAVADIPTPLMAEVTAYICGSPAFADAASAVVVDAGVPVERVRVERFGPSG